VRWPAAKGHAAEPRDNAAVASDGAADRPEIGPLELTVILCVRNGAAKVRDQLETLARQEWDASWEVLLVDNDSTDATPQVLRDFAAANPRFRVVDAHERLGLSHARNVGVANTQATAVAFCDDDDLVADGWVAAMGTALREHPIVACKFEWNELRPENAALDYTTFQRRGLFEVFGYPVAAGVSGWQRNLWNALGGNDESMTFTGEDFDMSIRAFLQCGVTPYFEPAAVCHVARRSGRRATFRQARRYGRASVVLYRRYGRGRADRATEVRASLREWASLVVHVFDLRDETNGSLWTRRAGARIGRLEQSIRSLTFWP
jgi:glycosyltransferase involved in cell wall biosynthesis